MFMDTDNPVCLALFTQKSNRINIYNDNTFIGTFKYLHSLVSSKNHSNKKIIFNHPNGKLGLIAFDNTRAPSIRFCRGDEIKRAIKHSDRLITRIDGDFKCNDTIINRLNFELNRIRRETHDVFFAPFKGLRKDGKYIVVNIIIFLMFSITIWCYMFCQR